MKKYIPKHQYPIEATQWFKDGDHEAVYPHPNEPTNGLIDDPWTEDDGSAHYALAYKRTVRPGDYIIHHWDGSFVHTQKGVFENS